MCIRDSNNISTLINDILMLSRIENMERKPEIISLNTNDIVNDVLESYAIEMKQHDIHIHYHSQNIIYRGCLLYTSTTKFNSKIS